MQDALRRAKLVLLWVARQWPAVLAVTSLVVSAHLFAVIKTLKVPVHKYGAMLREQADPVVGTNMTSIPCSDLATGQRQCTYNVASGIGGPPSGTAGGDLGGTYPNPTVVSVADITTGVLTSPHGGSAVASPTAHDPLVGEGSGAFASVNPGTVVGVPMVSNGTSVDPSFSFCTAAGGCLGADQTSCSGTTGAIPFWQGPSTHAASCVGASAGDQLFYTSDGTTSPTWGKPIISTLGTGTVTLSTSFQRAAAGGLTTPVDFAGHFVAHANCDIVTTTTNVSLPAVCCISINSISTCSSQQYTVNAVGFSLTPGAAVCGVGFQGSIAANTTFTFGALVEETVSLGASATCDVEAWLTQ